MSVKSKKKEATAKKESTVEKAPKADTKALLEAIVSDLEGLSMAPQNLKSVKVLRG